MNKNIIIGSLLSAILLFTIPSISAIEYDAIEQANEQKFRNFIQNVYINKFIEEFDDNDPQPKVIISILGIIIGLIFGALSKATIGTAAIIWAAIISIGYIALKISLIGAAIIGIIYILQNLQSEESFTNITNRIQTLICSNSFDDDPQPASLFGMLFGLLFGLIIRFLILGTARILDFLILLSPLFMYIAMKIGEFATVFIAFLVIIMQILGGGEETPSLSS